MHVEFLGVPRERAGVAELDVEADTLGRLLGTLASADARAGRADRRRSAAPLVAANLNGDRFISDPATPLATTTAS